MQQVTETECEETDEEQCYTKYETKCETVYKVSQLLLGSVFLDKTFEPSCGTLCS